MAGRIGPLQAKMYQPGVCNLKSPRRSILKGGALFAAATVLPSGVLASDEPAGTDFDKTHAAAQEALKSHFSKMGYQPSNAASIVTGDEQFNGGLRHDETGIIQNPGQMTVQQCSRIEDIGKKQKRDVLPLFHIFVCNKPLGFGSQQTVQQIIAYLVGPLGLDRTRLALVGTPRLNDYAPTLEKAGIDIARQAYLRDDSEALATADGSGYFRFPGNPEAPARPTVGMYYWIGEGTPRPLTAYPPSEDWTEIGEASLDDQDVLAFGLGTERITLASTGLMPSWQERLAQLLEYIENDSGGAEPPSGRAHFTKG